MPNSSIKFMGLRLKTLCQKTIDAIHNLDLTTVTSLDLKNFLQPNLLETCKTMMTMYKNEDPEEDNDLVQSCMLAALPLHLFYDLHFLLGMGTVNIGNLKAPGKPLEIVEVIDVDGNVEAADEQLEIVD